MAVRGFRFYFHSFTFNLHSTAIGIIIYSSDVNACVA
jgi:hypothetical protein